MDKFTYHFENGFVSAIEPLTNPISLTEPSNIFSLQNAVSNNLNTYQTTYSRYVRCQDPNTNPQVMDPSCNGQDSLTSLNNAYQSLVLSLNDLSGALATQYNTNAETPLQYQIETEKIPIDYAAMIQLRNDLDKQLQELQMQYQGGAGTSTQLLESAMFGNTLWVILASCLVYYIFVEL